MTLSMVAALFSNMRDGNVEKVPCSVASLVDLKLCVSEYSLENSFRAHLGCWLVQWGGGEEKNLLAMMSNGGALEFD